MRKLLLLFFALLTGVSGAWADTMTWTSGYLQSTTTAKVSAIGFTIGQLGTYTMSSIKIFQQTGDGAASTGIGIYNTISAPSSTNFVAFSSNVVASVESDGFVEYTFASPVALDGETSYYIYFYTSKALEARTYNSTTTQRIGLFGCGSGNYPVGVFWNSSAHTDYAPIMKATLTLTSANVASWENFLDTTLAWGNFNKIKVITPGTTSDNYSLSSFNLYTYASGAGADNKDNYLLISAKSTGDSYGLSKNEVLGVSSNSPASLASPGVSTYTFDTPVYLKGGSTYYLYFTKTLVDSYTASYTLKSQRIALDTQDASDVSTIYTSGTNYYAPRYSAILDELASAPTVTDSEGNELSESKTYRIALPGRAGTVVMTQNENYVNPQVWVPNTSQIWKVVKDGSDYKIHPAIDGDSKYWKADSYAEGNTKVSANNAEGDATSWTISKVSTLNNTYNITSDNGSGTTYYFSNYGGGTNNMGFYNTAAAYDGGSLFLFTPVSENNYRCETLAGSVLQSGTGYVAASADAAPVISNYTYSSVDTELDGTIVFKYRMTTPPTIYTSPAPTDEDSDGVLEFADGTVWYVIAQHSNYPKYWQMSGSEINGVDNCDLTDNNYLWCFVGSEAVGYQVYNRNGKGVSFTAGSAADVSGTTASTFDIRVSNAASGKFAFWLKDGAADSRSYLNMNVKVQSWSAADAGSTFYAIEVVALDINTKAAVKNVVGGYSNDNGTALSTAFNTWNSDPSETNFQALLDLYSSTPLMAIEEGVYYTILNATSDKGLLRTMNGYVGTSRKDGNDGTATQIWQFENAPTLGQYYIKNVASGKYIGEIPTSSNSSIPMSETPVAITVTANTSDPTWNIFYSSAESQTYKYMHESTGYTYGIIVWGGDVTASHWTIEPVEISEIAMLNPTALGVAADTTDVYMSYANNTGTIKQVPADVTVYKVEAAETANEVNMVEVTSHAIPSEGAVVLKTKNGVNIPLLPTDAAETLEDNLLEAGDGSTSVSGYLLAYKKDGDGTPKFYQMTDVTLADNKAYLPGTYFDSLVKEISLNFDDAVDTIYHIEDEAIKDGAKDNVVFNLAGQRLQKLQKGVNIVNGKKIFVK